MSDDSPTPSLPVSEPPPRNLTGKLILIFMFVIGGIVVVLTAYYVAENYPIFDSSEQVAEEQVAEEQVAEEQVAEEQQAVE